VNLQRAEQLLDRAQATAESLGVAMALAVVDAGGHPVAMRRMDGATTIAGDTVIPKARTAVHFGRATADVVDAAKRNPEVYSSFLEASESRLVLSMGGIPIVDADGVIVGAIAASGGTGAEDVAVSTAAIDGHQP
jgi:uncharacterized protein GlcG (DUF336 family)